MKKTCNQISNLYWFDLKADYLTLWLYVSLFILVARDKLLYVQWSKYKYNVKHTVRFKLVEHEKNQIYHVFTINWTLNCRV